jgi:hypothetical protein
MAISLSVNEFILQSTIFVIGQQRLQHSGEGWRFDELHGSLYPPLADNANTRSQCVRDAIEIPLNR